MLLTVYIFSEFTQTHLPKRANPVGQRLKAIRLPQQLLVPKCLGVLELKKKKLLKVQIKQELYCLNSLKNSIIIQGRECLNKLRSHEGGRSIFKVNGLSCISSVTSKTMGHRNTNTETPIKPLCSAAELQRPNLSRKERLAPVLSLEYKVHFVVFSPQVIVKRS